MKRFLGLCVAFLGLAGGLVAWAEEDGKGLYLRGDLGAAITPGVGVEELLGSPGNLEVEFNTGMRLGVGVGYRVLPWLAFEFETGYAFNGIDRLGYDEEVDALLFQVPLLVNVVVQCNNFGQFKPYVGVGAGGVMSLFMIDDVVTTGSGSAYVEGGDADMVFAYHAFAGMRYEINDQWSVGLLYRCMGSSAASWEVEDAFGGSMGAIGFDDLITHSISAQFELKF